MYLHIDFWSAMDGPTLKRITKFNTDRNNKDLSVIWVLRARMLDYISLMLNQQTKKNHHLSPSTISPHSAPCKKKLWVVETKTKILLEPVLKNQKKKQKT